MTPEPAEQQPPEDQKFDLDVKHYIAALERKNAQLLRENTAMDAVVAQLSEERDAAIAALEEAMQQPKHNGRVTTPKPRKPARKKV